MSTAKIKLRPINFRKDIRAVLQLEQRTFAEEAFDLEAFIYFYQIGRETFWVAVNHEQKVVAYVVANAKDEEGYIASIAVEENYRKQGLGKRILKQIMALLTDKKAVSHIRLHVRQSNRAAVRLYQTLEFVIEGEELNYYPDGETAYRMIYIPANSHSS